MYPIANWKGLRQGYKFGQKTFYSNFHLGTDKIVPVGTPVYAPFDGEARVSVGSEGGNTVTFYPTGMNIAIRFLHNSEMHGGTFKRGQLIAKTGNTGLSTAPHSHIDISKNKVDVNNIKNFIDPDTFNWEQQGDSNMKLSQLPDGEFNKELDMAFVKGNGSFTGSQNKQEWITAYGDLDVDGSQFRDKRWGHPARQNFIEKLEMSFRTGKMWTRQDFYNTKIKATDPVVRPDDPTTPVVDKAAIRDHANKILDLAK